MRKIFILFLIICFTNTSIAAIAGAPGLKAVIPLGGNAWLSSGPAVDDGGLTAWAAAQAVVSVYFRPSVVQTLKLSLRVRVPAGKSVVRVSAGSEVFTKELSNNQYDTLAIGNISVKKVAYIKINLKGISKTGPVFADVTDLIIEGALADEGITYVKPGSSYYFGKRGPSVHLRYDLPAGLKKNVQFFYNEITVPKGMDPVGSYYMADGFGEGYFGMQVNSATERRILFSVWSPFNTEDPKNIPDSMKIKMLAKGEPVHAGEFGNEGSGGQSYWVFPWQAGKTYAFLLSAQPDSVHHATTYTAWFKEAGASKWNLIASFNRPKTLTYLTSLYSFLESFEPDNGDKIRLAYYQNQWIGDSFGKWHELTNITYTGDATAKGNYRKDYAGGVDQNKFYLRNCGFFDDFVPMNQKFTRTGGGKQPVIDVKALPRQ